LSYFENSGNFEFVSAREFVRPETYEILILKLFGCVNSLKFRMCETSKPDSCSLSNLKFMNFKNNTGFEICG
jgi:hypothetical protein